MMKDSSTEKVLALCSQSGNILRPWAAAGYDCIAVDLKNGGETETVGSGTIKYIKSDVGEYEPSSDNYRIAFAFPPCTDLAVSGARWMSDKGLFALAESIRVVAECHEILASLDCPWMLENPVSTLSTYWRDPDWKFDPYEYDSYTQADETYSKETWLWTGGGFRMPVSDGADAGDDRIHKLPPSDKRSEIRARTPRGFSNAVYLSHHNPDQFAKADSDGSRQVELSDPIQAP